MENIEVARILNEYADLLDIHGENRFRVRSYRKVAQSIEGLSRSIEQMIQDQDDLTAIPGVGASMAEHLREIVKTGTLKALKELHKELPHSMGELIQLEQLGPKRAKQLHEQLGVSSVADLEKALKAGKVETLSGFGKTSAEKLRRAIKEFAQRSQRFKLSDADQLMAPLLTYMRKAPGIETMEVAGSYRRRKETIGDADVLVACETPDPIMKHFTAYPDAERVEMAGSTRGTILLKSGLKVDLRILPRRAYGAALHYFTGSKDHNVAVRMLGVERGLRISEYGVFRVPKGKKAEEMGKEEGKRIGGEREEDVFQAVGMAWVPPELREDRGEIQAAQQGTLPKLITVKDIRGNLHMHSTWTDGNHTIEDLVRACKDQGYEYCAITDHSRSTRVAGGLDAEGIQRQWEEIAEVRKRVKGIKLLASAEIDILPDGSLDYPDEILEQLDLVVVSLHSNLAMNKKQMTARVVKALSHPLVDIFAHPTAREIDGRGPVEMDLEEIFAAAKKYDVALELNAQPKRLDLSDVYVHRAKDQGILIAISTDAHSTDQLRYMRYGIDQARRGWLEKKNVVNTKPWRDFEKWLGRRTSRRDSKAARQGKRAG